VWSARCIFLCEKHSLDFSKAATAHARPTASLYLFLHLGEGYLLHTDVFTMVSAFTGQFVSFVNRVSIFFYLHFSFFSIICLSFFYYFPVRRVTAWPVSKKWTSLLLSPNGLYKSTEVAIHRSSIFEFRAFFLCMSGKGKVLIDSFFFKAHQCEKHSFKLVLLFQTYGQI
jgi:hypothetical protein